MDAAAGGESYNICIGHEAMGAADEDNQTIDSNIAIGRDALKSGDMASTANDVIGNIAIGSQSLDATSSNAHTGTIAIGHQALTACTAGNANTVIGYQAGDAILTGIRNTILGYQAGTNMGNAESSNVAVGYLAMGAVDEGGSGGDADGNIAIGEDALYGGDFSTNDRQLLGNVAIGYQALDGTAANEHIGTIAIGYQALTACTSASGNTAIGYLSGDVITDGSNNTLLGYGTDPHASGGAAQIVIGQGVTGTGDSIMTVGSGSNTASLGLDGSDTSWAAASSDERLKENIEESTAGLSFVNDLRPVTFNWKKSKDVQKDLPQYKDSEKPVLGYEYGETLHGFIAQEVKSAIDKHDDIKEGFKMWKLKEDGTETVADGNLMPVLVKAVQELSKKVEELEAKLSE